MLSSGYPTSGYGGGYGGSGFTRFSRLLSELANDGGQHPGQEGVPGPGDTTQDPGVPGPGNPPLPPGEDTPPTPPPTDPGPVTPIPDPTEPPDDWPRPGEMPGEPHQPRQHKAFDFALPRTGFRPQDAGGRGSPYVGTGWNNLSNFLNENNLNYGSKLNSSERITFDPSSPTRTQGATDFSNWMRNQNYPVTTKGDENQMPRARTNTGFTNLNTYLNGW